MLRLSGCDFSRTWTLGSAAYFEGDLLTVFQGGIAVHFDLRVVNKEIFATILGGDESVAFFGIEPFYISCTHILVFLVLFTKTRRLRVSAHKSVSYGLSAVAKNLI